MALFDLSGALKSTLGNMFKENEIKNKLGQASPMAGMSQDEIRKQALERANMSRQLEGLQKANQGGFMSNLGGQMMSNARANLGLGGFQGEQTPMIGGTSQLSAIAAPDQMMQLNAMRSAGMTPYMPTQGGGFIAGTGGRMIPVSNTQAGLLGALNVPDDYASKLKQLMGMFSGGKG